MYTVVPYKNTITHDLTPCHLEGCNAWTLYRSFRLCFPWLWGAWAKVLVGMILKISQWFGLCRVRQHWVHGHLVLCKPTDVFDVFNNTLEHSRWEKQNSHLLSNNSSHHEIKSLRHPRMIWTNWPLFPYLYGVSPVSLLSFFSCLPVWNFPLYSFYGYLNSS